MKHFTSFIADFVIYGQPTHGTKEKAYVQHWPAFTEGNGVSMIIDNPPRLSRDMPFEYGFERRGRISLWMKLLGHQVDLKEDYTPDIHDEL